MQLLTTCLMPQTQTIILMGGWYEKLASRAKTMTRRSWEPKTKKKFLHAWYQRNLVRVWDSQKAKSGKPYGHVNTVGFILIHAIWEEKLGDMQTEHVVLEGGEKDQTTESFLKKNLPGADKKKLFRLLCSHFLTNHYSPTYCLAHRVQRTNANS